VLFLGDYIYEHMSDGGAVRYVQEQLGPQPVTVAGYRQRHAQYRSDPDLQAAHAIAPWIPVIDDHEVHDNWAGDEALPYLEVPGYPFLDQRANAFQAYYEHMPLRSRSRPHGPDMRFSRRLGWGRLATFYALDTRQFRSDHTDDVDEANDPRRTMTGDAQERWLVDSMAASDSVWNIVLNQTMFVRRDTRAGSAEGYSLDAWDGYLANRQRILDGWAARTVDNVVVMTGNEHRNYAGNILADFGDPDSPVIGAEFVGTSISSGGDGVDLDDTGQTHLDENPWLAFTNAQRGYLRVDVDAGRLRTDFRVLPYVETRGAPVSTRASYVVEAGKPGIEAD
jgi:alkaline phosphatase D